MVRKVAGNANSMYRWPWLEAKIRRHPWIGLGIVLAAFLLCVWVLATAADERSPRSGAPMWVIALVGIPLFGFVGIRYVVLIRRGWSGREK